MNTKISVLDAPFKINTIYSRMFFIIMGSMQERELKERIGSSNIDSQSLYPHLSPEEADYARNTYGILRRAVLSGHVPFNSLHRVADFGAGYGGASLAVRAIVDFAGGEVIALEKDGNAAESIIRTGILPQERVVVGDGVTYLESLADRGGPPFGLITAFGLFGGVPGLRAPTVELFQRLVKALTNGSLEEGGRLLVHSDRKTMDAVERSILDSNVGMTRVIQPTIPVFHSRWADFADALVFNMESLRKIAKS